MSVEAGRTAVVGLTAAEARMSWRPSATRVTAHNPSGAIRDMCSITSAHAASKDRTGIRWAAT